MLAEGPAEEKVRGFGSTVADAMSGTSAQRAAGLHSAGDGGTVTGVGGQDSGHVCCAMWLLTPPDFRALRWSGWQ